MRVAAVGETHEVEGFALAGALVVPADERAQVRAAVDDLVGSVGVLILTARAAALLPADLLASSDVAPGRALIVVMPE